MFSSRFSDAVNRFQLLSVWSVVRQNGFACGSPYRHDPGLVDHPFLNGGDPCTPPGSLRSARAASLAPLVRGFARARVYFSRRHGSLNT